ncbi:MAG: response regulator [Candidatus Sabulitectum sp.]|nr:response regulator [Candidatus Sabulitectum sp.]
MKEKFCILLVDDDQRMAMTLADIFKVKGYWADVAHSGKEALERIAKTHYDCIFSDIKMSEINGVELCRAVKKNHPEIPFVLMTAYSHDVLVKDGLEEGAEAVLTKPLNINALLGYLTALQKQQSIVIVDDDPEFCRTLGDILLARGFIINQIFRLSDIVDEIKPDVNVVLLDMKLNGFNGLDVLKKIREKYPHLPVILVTGYRAEMMQYIEYALKNGAYFCLYKPLEIESLLQILNRVRKLELSSVLEQPVKRGGVN